MIDVPLSSVMNESPARISPETPIAETATRLRQPEVAAVVVRDSTDNPAGIVTESDVVAVVAEGGGNVPVESFMSTPVITASEATPIGIAADRMRDAGVMTLVVVDSEGTDVGIVTREDLAPYLSRHRLEIDWKTDPLRLDETDEGDTPRMATAEMEGATE